MTNPWLILGDFNSILSADDKRGGVPFNRSRHKSFIDTVEVCGLSDLRFDGPRFTWSRNRVLVRLDRALVNNSWLAAFPESHVVHAHKLKSDHRPIFVRPSNQVFRSIDKPFRFMSAWFTHNSFLFFLSKKWPKGSLLPTALQSFAKDLRHWNKHVFGNIFRRKARLTNKLKEAEHRSALNPSAANLETENDARIKLEAVLWQEESLWLQKSRAKWLVEGDRNTNFFHSATIRRRAFNRITRLQDLNGNWVESQPELQSLATKFFEEFYKSNGLPPARLHGFSACISSAEADALDRVLCQREVYEAIKTMGPLKAPGKDGFSPIFYQRCWETVGKDFTDFVVACFRDPALIKEMNETLITLIPKVPKPTTMNDFRPISLCNVAYKSLTKCIANRVKNLMGKLTHPSQTSFVPGRHITDNIIIVQEAVHSLRTKKTGIPGMIVKVDLSKAYDKIEWEFVNDTLRHAGFPVHLRDVIMNCISTPTFQVLWNGSCSASFTPSRGLRQGCPLSPYLFTLCIERLSQMITSAVTFDYWKPIRLVRNGEPLSHIFFADDLVFFGHASVTQARVFMDIIERFCTASGQSINKSKSRVFFSAGMNRNTSRSITDIMGIRATQDLGHYLGVPLLHGRITRNTYEFLLTRLDDKLAGWKANTLSLAGRVTLASSVLNSIPSYVMQTTALPGYICEGIDRKIRNFIWGSTNGVRKIHNINWEMVCRPKNLGGLGLRSARELNRAFLMKLVWGVLSRPDELWVKVLASKYLKHTNTGWVPARKTGLSPVWREMLKVWNYVEDGLQWSIRDGKGTRFWLDKWVNDGTVLIDQALNITRIDPTLTVSDCCNSDGTWNMDLLHATLLPSAIPLVVGMQPPKLTSGADRLVWGLEENGVFSIKTAYLILKDLNMDGGDYDWRLAWRWKGPNRIKHFIWLVFHNRILTNEERNRRHLTNQVVCPRCSIHSESLSHVIRDCCFALQVWENVLPNLITDGDSSLDFKQWWREKLADDTSSISVGVTAWVIWKARNNLIFEGIKDSVDAIANKCRYWINLILTSWKANQLGREAPGLARQALLVAWRPGDEGWSTLNTDGSRHHSTRSTAIGGVLRDSDGRFARAFCANIGDCSITRAELKAIIEGMRMAWDLGVDKLHIQTDSSTAVSTLLSTVDQTHQHFLLLLEYQDLLSRPWQVRITHVFREANQAADYMANRGHSFDFGTFFFDSPDPSLCNWLRYDQFGVALPRFVRSNN
ncbi:Putative ribonuclease H protein At1g65750 [Linum perenne]